MNTTLVGLSLLTGLLVGGLFAFFKVPIPAPPNLAGVMGIVGIFLGYRLVAATEIGFNLLDALGI
ncbi:MAG: XapX domain-containing protein [Halobacteriaceae archaeon]